MEVQTFAQGWAALPAWPKWVFIAALAVNGIGGSVRLYSYVDASDMDNLAAALLAGDDAMACAISKRMVEKFTGRDEAELNRWRVLEKTACEP